MSRFSLEKFKMR